MKKLSTLVIAYAMLMSFPALAESSGHQVSDPILENEMFTEDLPLIDDEYYEELDSNDMDTLRHRPPRRGHGRYYCPRGYRLERRYVRIGRIVYTRYECVRVGRRHDDRRRGDRHRRYELEQPGQLQTEH